jgi:hypothetical protein
MAAVLRKIALSLISLAALVLGALSAEACTPPLPTFIAFNANSSELPQDRVGALREVARKGRGYSVRCSSFELRGYIDPSENGDLVVARTETVRKFLVADGALDELVVAKVERVPVAPPRGNPYFRAVTVRWSLSVGQWRCDPASDNPIYSSAACQTRYSRCYLVLGDGTICNPQNLTDPNPETYSVIN